MYVATITVELLIDTDTKEQAMTAINSIAAEIEEPKNVNAWNVEDISCIRITKPKKILTTV